MVHGPSSPVLSARHAPNTDFDCWLRLLTWGTHETHSLNLHVVSGCLFTSANALRCFLLEAWNFQAQRPAQVRFDVPPRLQLQTSAPLCPTFCFFNPVTSSLTSVFPSGGWGALPWNWELGIATCKEITKDSMTAPNFSSFTSLFSSTIRWRHE